MKKEKEFMYSFKVEFAHLDKDSYIKPDGYQRIISKVIDEHLMHFSMDCDVCHEQNFSWVIVALNVVIKKHVKGCVGLHVKTWFSERKRLHFRREVEARDDAGDVVFVASLYSVLIDLNTHTIYRKPELPIPLMEATPEFLLESSPLFKEKLDFRKTSERVVYKSYIDALGHVNNCRYGEFALDSLNDEYADLSLIKAFDIYFCSELRLEDEFIIEENIEDKIVLHGYNKTKEKTSFYCVFHRNI